MEGVLKLHEKYRVQSYLKGTFVMRVRINAIDPSIVFFWREASNK